MIEEKNIPARIGEAKIESELKKAMHDVVYCEPEPLVKFIPVLLDRLLMLMVKPPILMGQPANLASACFSSMASIVDKLTVRISRRS